MTSRAILVIKSIGINGSLDSEAVKNWDERPACAVRWMEVAFTAIWKMMWRNRPEKVI